MEKQVAARCVLRLTEVAPGDYASAEDMNEERILDQQAADDGEETAGINAKDVPFDKIPPVFSGLDDWPVSTNLKCWGCDMFHDNVPWFQPTSLGLSKSEDSLVFGVLGSMCSVHCVASYVEANIRDREERLKVEQWLIMLYFIRIGETVTHIEPAPPKYKRTEYGGEWDATTYTKKLRELNPHAGVKNHTPGSVLPERERTETSVWELCGAQRRAEASESLAILISHLRPNRAPLVGARRGPDQKESGRGPDQKESGRPWDPFADDALSDEDLRSFLEPGSELVAGAAADELPDDLHHAVGDVPPEAGRHRGDVGRKDLL